MSLRLRLSDGYSGSDTSSDDSDNYEDERKEVRGEVILDWESQGNRTSRPLTYSPNLLPIPNSGSSSSSDGDESESTYEKKEILPLYRNDAEFELNYDASGRPLQVHIEDSSDEEEKEEEVHDSEDEYGYVERKSYRPNLVLVQTNEEKEEDEATATNNITEDEEAVVVVEEEEEEEKDEAIRYPSFSKPLEATDAESKPKLTPPVYAEASSSAASSSASSSQQEMRNRIATNDVRFLRTQRDRSSVCEGVYGRPFVRCVETVFFCGSINRCSKALWAWPYSVWPRFVFLRFRLLETTGKSSTMAYCMNYQEGEVHFGAEPFRPPDTEERAYPLHISQEQNDALFEYCLNQRANIVYDRWEDHLSMLPFLGPKIVNFWRRLSFSRKDVHFAQQPCKIWATSHSLIYMAFLEVIFSHSHVKHPKQMCSLAELFLFVEDTVQDQV